MSACLEKCNDIARTKAARILYGTVLVLMCCFGVYRLMEASNKMNDERQSHLQLLFKPQTEHFLYFSSKPEVSETWKEQFEKYLEPYQILNPNSQKCNAKDPPAPDKFCEVDLDAFGPCSPRNDFGMQKYSVCIFLKFRHIPESKLEYYNNTRDLPKSMSDDLRNHIQDISTEPKESMNVAWISCEGLNPVDSENMKSIAYIPKRGFSDNQISRLKEGDLEPVLAVHFPKLKRGIVIGVSCKLWTKNSHDKVSFDLMLD